MKRSRVSEAVALAVALGGLGAAAYVPTVGAVNAAANGLGEVLIFPYYTTRDNWQTTLTIINTDETHVVAAKMRFIEGQNSRDVLDFNVILSPGDVFAGVVEEGPSGPRFRHAPNDTTCTSPVIAAGGSLNLNTAAFTGTSDDGGGQTVDRLREGYVVVQVMGQALPTAVPSAVHGDKAFNCATASGLFVKNGAVLPAAQLFGEPDNVLKGNFSFLNVPRGTAAGGNAVTLANMATFANGGGTYEDLPAGPRSNCTVPFFAATANGSNVKGIINPVWDPNTDTSSCPNLVTAQQPFDFLEPSLNDAYPPVAVVPYNDHSNALGGVHAGVSYTAFPDTSPEPTEQSTSVYGFQAVSEVLRATSLVNEWSINAKLGVSTDWVVTMPTKSFFTDSHATDHQAADNQWRFPIGSSLTKATVSTYPRNLTMPSTPMPPFAEDFGPSTATAHDGKSCNTVAFRVWNRDEVNASPGSGGAVPSPAEPEPNLALCYEANVIPFTDSTTAPTTSAVFGSVLLPEQLGNLYTALGELGDIPARYYGWMQLKLDIEDVATTAGGTTLNGPGLPAVGFMIRQRVIGETYSDMADHSAVKLIDD